MRFTRKNIIQNIKPIVVLVSICLIHFSSLAQIDRTNIFDHGVENLKIEGLEYAIHKATEYDGIIWGVDYGRGNVYKSIDEGINWKKLATLGSEYFEVIQFLDINTGVVCGDYGFVYKTTDGGNTWHEISPMVEKRITERYRNDPSKNQEPVGNAVAYYGMHFITENEGYVFGFKYQPSTGFRKSFEKIMFTTNDSGKSWTAVEVSEQEQTIEHFKSKAKKDYNTIHNEYFIDANLSYSTDKNKAKEDVIIQTNYKANTKDTIVLPKTRYNRIMLRNISFLTKDLGFIFGGALNENEENAIIYQTSDAGKSWKIIDIDWPHIHAAIRNKKYLWLFGKKEMIKRINITNIE